MHSYAYSWMLLHSYAFSCTLEHFQMQMYCIHSIPNLAHSYVDISLKLMLNNLSYTLSCRHLFCQHKLMYPYAHSIAQTVHTANTHACFNLCITMQALSTYLCKLTACTLMPLCLYLCFYASFKTLNYHTFIHITTIDFGCLKCSKALVLWCNQVLHLV